MDTLNKEKSTRSADDKRTLFAQNCACVDRFVEEFRKIPDDLITNKAFLANFIIENIGLNDEILHEQPEELYSYMGTGLHLWQYPNQFSKLIAWLIKNAKQCHTYLVSRLINCDSKKSWLLVFQEVCDEPTFLSFS